MSALFPFHGGLKTVRHKTESNTLPIEAGPLPRRLIVPLRQHMGNAAKPCVQPGDRVLKGQMIGQPDGFISAAVHAPSSGVVAAVARGVGRGDRVGAALAVRRQAGTASSRRRPGARGLPAALRIATADCHGGSPLPIACVTGLKGRAAGQICRDRRRR